LVPPAAKGVMEPGKKAGISAQFVLAGRIFIYVGNQGLTMSFFLNIPVLFIKTVRRIPFIFEQP
jgi:hypothetical protein